jgi:hypothetical protein
MSYKFPAWCQMQTALDDYAQDREAYLKAEAAKLGPDGERRLREFNNVADSLVKGVQDLAGAGLGSFVELVRSPASSTSTPFELLMEHVCVTFGWEVMSMLDTARERFTSLLFLLRDRQPCGEARAFLQRIARCYLFGFDAECVVMCRATLDQEFRDQVVNDDQVSEWWNWYKTTSEGKKHRGKEPPYGQLWALILAAEHAKMITADCRIAANAVKDAGNKGVHKKPSSDDALERIGQTIKVLDELEAARPRRRR